MAFDALRARLPGFRIPDAVWDNWLSRWVQDLFLGFIRSSDRLPTLAVAAAVEDVRAGVAALRYVMANGFGEQSGTFCASVFPSQVGFPHLPTVEEVRRHHPAFFLRAESGWFPDGERPERLDAGQFLNRLSFLLNEPTEADWAWLERVAYQIDPVQPRETPAPPEAWARRIFPEVIPGLSLCLEISYDPHIVDPGTPLPVLVAHVHSWYLTAREAVQRQVKNATQALTPVIPSTLTAAPLNPLPIIMASSDLAVQIDRTEAVIEISPVETDHPPTGTEVLVPDGTSGGKKGLNINARMLDVLSKNLDSYYWSASQWGDYLGCGKGGSVKQTKAWDQIKVYRASQAAERVARTGALNGGKRKPRQ